MDVKKILKFNKADWNFKKAGKTAAAFWMRHHQIIFISFFLFVAGAGLFLWYQNLYKAGWSEERKRQHALSQNQEVNLKEGEFRKVLEEITRRKTAFNSEYQTIKDIFRPY
ncbi:MAG: hypothetical protein NT136_00855 [Candidatus Moranbacteria bacterium]|nr:hypothetical protein [Candidatus Moranbacteria bacterium]